MGTGNANAKLTNQMFVPAASVLNNNLNSQNITQTDGPDSLNATYISVVCISSKFFCLRVLFININIIIFI